MRNSKRVVEDYQQAMHNGSKQVKNIEFNVQILTSGSWPFIEAPKCQIPPIMKDVQDDFKRYYVHTFKNRQLMWFPDYAQLQLETSYLPKKY